MQEIGVILGVLILIVLGAVAIAALLGAVLVVAALTSIACLFWLPAQWFRVMIRSLNAEPEEIGLIEDSMLGKIFRLASHADRENSYPHYFFGPVGIDTRNIVHSSYRSVRDTIKMIRSRAWSFVAVDPELITFCLGIAIMIGLVPGCIVGVIATTAVMVIYCVATIICAAGAALLGIVLRIADVAARSLAGIHLSCPMCAHAVRPYAAYKCPSCRELHHDIRPGRRGISRRVCRCGGRIPTLLLVGAGHLSAMCPECGAALPKRFGKIPIIVVPFFGSVKAGKTQLIYTLALTLCALIEVNGGVADFIDDTSREIGRIGNQISETGSPQPTVARTPEAFVLHLKLGGYERYMYFFDPAGELHYSTDSLDELHYLDKANTLIFVADPLAAENVWVRLGAKQQEDLLPVRSDWSEVELAYELPREQMRRMGSKGRSARLGFVVTKEDILEKAGVSAPRQETVREFVSSAGGMDMGNLVREAERSFETVEYFKTAAVIDKLGDPDDSVEGLAIWLLASEGITLGGSLDNE